ncbi:ankyrin repeat domain-containing protein [Leptolyngbya sp. AN03gr2]|uniref:ankyrin repeat domain-containing protein n=1 Tax=unclassified Leptolyngbya TaxID=2650499 RepID=UPI003D314110
MIRFRNVDSVIAVLDRGEDINAVGDEGQPPLSLAIQWSQFKIAKVLIRRGANANAVDSHQATPIHHAIDAATEWRTREWKPDDDENAIADQVLELIQLLIDHGADINWNCGLGNVDTPLHRAVWQRQPRIVELLIQAGAEINANSRSHRTPIDIAAYMGYRDMIDLLLGYGATKSLHVAAGIGEVETIGQYLKSGGDPDIRLGSGYGCPMLYIAATHHQLEVARLLIQAGATIDMNCEQDNRDIETACQLGDREMVSLLIENGAEIGSSLVWEAATGGHTQLVKFLIERYNLAVQCDDCRWNPADAAAIGGHLETLEFLMAQGAFIISKEIIYWTALNGHPEMVQFLANHNFDPNIRAYDIDTALEAVAERGDAAMVKTLLSVGADVNAGIDTRKRTALHHAAIWGHLEVIQLLVAAGAEVNAKAWRGETPLQVAGWWRHDDVIDFLIQQGAKG